jgi:hypothetical protein
MLNKYLLPLALALIPAAAFATDAKLVGDASVSSANPSLNFGNLPNLTAGSGNVSLVQFDLSPLPAGSTSSSVLKATLQIFVNRVGTSGTLSVAPVLTAWNESTVSYTTLPGIGSSIGTGVTTNIAGEYVSFDVTTQVQEWIAAPGSNFGLALTSTGLVYLDSKENTTTSHPAKLDVTVAGVPAGAEFVETPHGVTNTAAGYSSLNDPSGFFNTAFGESTLGASSGSVYNTAIGNGALQNATVGSVNTAVGANALNADTTGQWNQAFGAFALANTTTGQYNTAAGFYAMSGNVTGFGNTGFGQFTFYTNTTGSENTALGSYAGFYSTTGSWNTFVGATAGETVTTGSYNIMIGNTGAAADSNLIRIGDYNQTRTFISGIRGITTGVSNAVEVVIDTNGQLGTINSSRRFKNDIADMKDASDGLMKLRPVTFHYKQGSADGVDRLEYGLIAEEVAAVYPDAVTYTPTGETETIQYHKINAMMLNEMQKQERKIQEQTKELEGLRERLANLEQMLNQNNQQ